jgi:hypothetical protein
MHPAFFKSQVKSTKLCTDFREFPAEDSGNNKATARADQIADFFCVRQKQIRSQIGAYQIVAPARAQWPASQVAAPQSNTRCNTIFPEIAARGAHGFRVAIKGQHRSVTQLCGRDGQDCRPGANIQERLFASDPPALCDAFQAKRRGGMMAGPKAQSGVQDDDALAASGGPPAPAGFDEKMVSDFDRFEVALPRFSPIAAGKRFDRDPDSAWIKAKSPQPFHFVRQSGGKPAAGRRQAFWVRSHENPSGFLVAKDGRRLEKSPFQKSCHSLFTLPMCQNGDLPHGRRSGLITSTRKEISVWR